MASQLTYLLAAMNEIRKLYLKYNDQTMEQLKRHCGESSDYYMMKTIVTDTLRKLEFGQALICNPDDPAHSEETRAFLKTLETQKQKDEYKLAVVTRLISIVKLWIWPCADTIYKEEFPSVHPLLDGLKESLTDEEKKSLFAALKNIVQKVEPMAQREGWIQPNTKEYVKEMKKTYGLS